MSIARNTGPGDHLLDLQAPIRSDSSTTCVSIGQTQGKSRVEMIQQSCISTQPQKTEAPLVNESPAAWRMVATKILAGCPSPDPKFRP